MYKIIKLLRARLLVFLTHNLALPLLQLVRKPERFNHNLDSLSSFNNNTLGFQLAAFLKMRGLKLLPYYAKHDVKHILLNYDTTEEGEVCLQCFMLGNGHISFPVAATVLYGLFTMPEYWSKFHSAYRRGRNASPIKDWKWFDILNEDIGVLRLQIERAGKQPQ